ncbi:Phospholipase A-2-activating protein [Paragonimus heterotremus]|uniref:Phospholipase A-2-activating protein n=1 Tax=Paragonimus heterotremus TaxID=100268 RepID=A0A8J4SNM1_9TREM|nr:Phospholipase A-2-activating protein [Paragonimus heterotremus]
MTPTYKFRCALLGHTSDVRSLVCPTVDSIISGSRDFTVITWKLSRGGTDFHSDTILRGHENYVSSVTFHTTVAGNQLIYTGSHDKLIRVFVPGCTTAAYCLAGHTDTVCALAVDTRGALISGSWDKSVKIWYDKQCLTTIQGHGEAVWCVLVLPTSCVSATAESDFVILTGSADGLIRIWRAECVYARKAGQETRSSLVKTLRGHTGSIRSLARVDVSRVLSASNDASIRAWHIPSGQCVGEFYGHTHFVYALSTRPNSTVFVSSGEDRCVRVWTMPSESEWGVGKQFSPIQCIPLPCQSAWCVALTPENDIVVGGSDSAIRIFSSDPKRQASASAIQTFEAELASSKIAAPNAPGTGDLNPEKLPGIEALLQPGNKEGQILIVNQDGRPVCFQWSSSDARWLEIGDVVGTGQSKLAVYEGKEYDFVFSVDISDDLTALKLPYNRTEDPWFVAQRFLHEHNLPQDYLDTVAQFIIRNAGPQINPPSYTASDPFTGADRYIPGSLSSSSNIKLEAFNEVENKPISAEILSLIRNFAFDLPESQAVQMTTALLQVIPNWRQDQVFPLLDLLRCLVFWPPASDLIFSESNWSVLFDMSLGHTDLPQANCLLVLRLLANAVAADGPRYLTSMATDSSLSRSLVIVIDFVPKLSQMVDRIKQDITQRKQHQVALATLIHNTAVLAHLATSSKIGTIPLLTSLRVIPSLCIRLCLSFLSLGPHHGPGGIALFHPDAVFAVILGLGTALLSATLDDMSPDTSDEIVKAHRVRLISSAAPVLNASVQPTSQRAEPNRTVEDELAAWEEVRRVINYWASTPTCSPKVRGAAIDLLRLLE